MTGPLVTAETGVLTGLLVMASAGVAMGPLVMAEEGVSDGREGGDNKREHEYEHKHE